MSQNMLVERLKFAKRELTALKTAHRRASSLLKIYSYWYSFSDFNIPVGYLGDALVTIQFSSRFAAYPFVYGIGNTYFGQSQGSYLVLTSYGTAWFEFTNSGFTVKLHASIAYYNQYGLTGFYIKSTSPIISISCVQE